jgi:hypothetical protein
VGVLAVVMVVAVVTVVSQRSGRTLAAASAAATTTPVGAADPGETTATSAPVVGDGWPSAPTGPVVCRGYAPFFPEGCTPDLRTTASVAEALACLSLIQSAAQAMAVDSDTYARVVTQPTNGGTVDDVIHEQLTQARLFVASQYEKTGKLSDPELVTTLKAFDTAIRMAETRPCSETPSPTVGSVASNTTSGTTTTPAASNGGDVLRILMST